MSVINNFMSLHNVVKLSTNMCDVNIKKRYDEPGYVSFKLNFSAVNIYNDVSEFTSYDYMPHPLFQKPNGQTDEYLYSAVSYLRNINEPTRANMLLEFIDLFNIIQNDYQWYFRSIKGIDKLFDVDTKRGKRISKDAFLEIECDDTVDRRLFYLFSLYKKIAWDDTYQRWILPDLMRFFRLTIYVTEFRTFHRPYNTITKSNVVNDFGRSSNTISENSKNFIKSVISDVKNIAKDVVNDTIGGYVKTVSDISPIALKTLNNIFPTHILECEMCEFDISSFACDQYQSIDMSQRPDACVFRFKVNVGKVNEKSNYPIFRRMFDDIKLNSTYRIDETNIYKLDNKGNNVAIIENNIANDKIHIPENKLSHRSGEYYHESSGSFQSPLTTSHTKAWINKNMYLNNNTVVSKLLDNATSFGVAKIENTISDSVNRLKMQDIAPGINFNSLQSMVSSGDVISTLGMLRRAIQGTYESNLSSATSKEIDGLVDSTFSNLLSEYSKAEVSDAELALRDMARQALVDMSLYENIKTISKATSTTDINQDIYTNMYNIVTENNNKISNITFQRTNDFSKATDKVGIGEDNLYKTNIDDATMYKEMKLIPISKATDGIVIYEGLPTS